MDFVTLDLLADMAALAYLLVLVLAAFDVVVPILPSESVVILGGVLAWQGRLHPIPLIAAAAAGAIAGDHLSYAIGRWTQRGRPQAGRRGDRRMGKAERLQIWAARQLDRRGPSLLIVARFIPGGRTASTFMAGRTAYPLRRFTPPVVVAGLVWATLRHPARLHRRPGVPRSDAAGHGPRHDPRPRLRRPGRARDVAAGAASRGRSRSAAEARADDMAA